MLFVCSAQLFREQSPIRKGVSYAWQRFLDEIIICRWKQNANNQFPSRDKKNKMNCI